MVGLVCYYILKGYTLEEAAIGRENIPSPAGFFKAVSQRRAVLMPIINSV